MFCSKQIIFVLVLVCCITVTTVIRMTAPENTQWTFAGRCYYGVISLKSDRTVWTTAQPNSTHSVQELRTQDTSAPAPYCPQDTSALVPKCPDISALLYEK